MPSSNQIEGQLEKIYNWQLVSSKNNILRGLRKVLDDDEVIEDLLDGFYSRAGTSSANDEKAGVMFLTDKRICFISNEKSRRAYEIVNYNEIENVEHEKKFASVILKFNLKDQSIIFKSFVTEVTARNVLDRISRSAATSEIKYKDSSTSLLDNLTNLFVNRVSIPDFFDKIKSEKAVESGIGIEDEVNDDLINLNFLFLESKKINRFFSEYTDFNQIKDLKEKIMSDLIVLSSLCSISSDGLNDSEMFFISLVMMPLNPGKSSDIKKNADNLFKMELFPPEYRDVVMDYWQSISHYIKSTKIDLSSNSLESLAALKKYDALHGTAHFDKLGTAYFTYSQCLMKSDGDVNQSEEERLKQISYLIYNRESYSDQGEIEKAVDAGVEDEKAEEETLEMVMKKINKLVGMKKIKEEINTFINLIKVQKERIERGLKVTPLSLHAVFHGPPGTGKTTIARLLGKVYKCLGLLKKGQLIETDRAGVVAGYVGQTAIKVDEVVQKALDGILFIDEAYALSPEGGGADFGQEAIDAILKRMEDYRDRFVVIVAGYPDEMKRFINSNPGLKSRFSRYFYFDHYEPGELIKIFDIFCNNVDFKVAKSAREKLLNILGVLYEKRDRSFGNGRLVRNIFEKMVEKQANRIAGITPLTDKILCTITKKDIPEKDEIN